MHAILISTMNFSISTQHNRSYNIHAILSTKINEVLSSLKLCLEPTELLQQGGNRPLRACGTRFISNKVVAIGCVLERYGAYIAHLTVLIEDSSTKAADKQKLRGQWCDSKVLLGCVLFHDILKPTANLCKVLQEDEIRMVTCH